MNSKKTIPPCYYFNHVPLADGVAIENFFKKHGIPQLETDSWTSEPGTTVFIHDAKFGNWEKDAKQNMSTNFVFMSRVPSRLKGTNAGQFTNIFICEFPADELDGNHQVNELFSQLKDGISPDWNLLKRGTPSQWLIAAYLLLVAKQDAKVCNPEDVESIPNLLELWELAAKAMTEEAPQFPKSWADFNSLDGAGLCTTIDQVKVCLKRSVRERRASVGLV